MIQKDNITGVIGEYYMAAELGGRGIVGLSTFKNNSL